MVKSQYVGQKKHSSGNYNKTVNKLNIFLKNKGHPPTTGIKTFQCVSQNRFQFNCLFVELI